MHDGRYAIGRQIGNYQLIAKINSGAYGSVYQGRHYIFEGGPVVALKRLYVDINSPEQQKEFVQEARILHKLKHPHILTIIDAGIAESVPYLVMEYMAGGSLQEKFHQRGGRPFALKEALIILSQLGAALHYAHQHNVVHRDLKPGNILFTGQGKVCLADFGLSVVLTTAKTGNIGPRGTPSYMAPEQFEGKLSAKSDQYALGCICYELLTGRKPFQVPNPSLEAMWYQHTKVTPTPPRQFNPTLPPAVEQAILTAMAKDRNGRYRDVSAFLSALGAASMVNAVLPTPPAMPIEPMRSLATAYCIPSATSTEPMRSSATAYRIPSATSTEPMRSSATAYRIPSATSTELMHSSTTMKSADAYRKQGDGLRKHKRYEHALAAYEHALHVNPIHAMASYGKGLVLYELKRYKEALDAYEHASRVDPNNAEAYTSKGQVLYDLKRYGEALAVYQQALLVNRQGSG